jgi:hypothetical protein
MLLAQLQSVLATLVAVSLVYWMASQHRRNMRTWEALAERFGPLNADDKAATELQTQTAEIQVYSTERLRTMHLQAGIMLEMADYAERNGSSVDPLVLAALRRDAIGIRLETTKELIEVALLRPSS